MTPYHGLGGDNYLGGEGSTQDDDEEEEYKITEQEFAALLAKVKEELQREEELLEEELWEMERADALEREGCFIKLMIMMIEKN